MGFYGEGVENTPPLPTGVDSSEALHSFEVRFFSELEDVEGIELSTTTSRVEYK